MKIVGHSTHRFEGIIDGLLVERTVTWVRRCSAAMTLRHRGETLPCGPLYFTQDQDDRFMHCLQGIVSKVFELAPMFAIVPGDQLRIDLDVRVVDEPMFDHLNGDYSPAGPPCEPRVVSAVDAIYNTLECDRKPLMAWIEEMRKA